MSWHRLIDRQVGEPRSSAIRTQGRQLRMTDSRSGYYSTEGVSRWQITCTVRLAAVEQCRSIRMHRRNAHRRRGPCWASAAPRIRHSGPVGVNDARPESGATALVGCPKTRKRSDAGSTGYCNSPLSARRCLDLCEVRKDTINRLRKKVFAPMYCDSSCTDHACRWPNCPGGALEWSGDEMTSLHIRRVMPSVSSAGFHRPA